MKHLVLGCIILFIFKAAGQSYSWAITDTSYQYSNGVSIACDTLGNIAVVETYQNPGAPKGINIIKYDTNHSLIWEQQIKGDYISSSAITLDNNGDVCYGGTFSNHIAINGITYSSSCQGCQSMMVVKFDSQGVFQWLKQTTGSDAGAASISTDNENNIYVAGQIIGSVNFDNQNVYNPGYALTYVAKYSSSGNFRWVSAITGNSSASPYGLSIKTDKQGNSYLGGVFHGPINFGSILLPSYGDADIYLAKMDSSGNWLWARHGGGSYQEGFYALDTDGNGNLYLTGFYGSSSVTFGNFTFNNPSGEDYFLVKYDTTGTVLWAKHGTKSGYYANSFCVDKAGNSYMVTYNSFILKHDNAGNAGWTLNTAVSNVRMASDKKGSIYVTGWLSAPTSFGSTTLTPIKPNQMYLAKIYDSSTITTNVTEQMEYDTVQVYPNPCTHQLLISMSKPMSGTIKIFNTVGATVYTECFKEYSVNWSREINISHLPKGLYVIELINLNSKDIIRAKKLIIE